jgi:hypothetical protein
VEQYAAFNSYECFCVSQQKDDKLTTMEKQFNEMQSQMQSFVSTLSKLTEQGQVNTVAQTLYSSGILKEGKEIRERLFGVNIMHEFQINRSINIISHFRTDQRNSILLLHGI